MMFSRKSCYGYGGALSLPEAARRYAGEFIYAGSLLAQGECPNIRARVTGSYVLLLFQFCYKSSL
jgi:hypothetical protein